MNFQTYVLLILLSLIHLEGNGQKIAFLLDDFESDRWIVDSSAFYQKATQLGAEAIIGHCDTDTEKQLSLAKNYIDSLDIKCLVLVPADRQKAHLILDYAKSKSVPTLLYDRLASGPADYYITFDGHEIGRMQAQFIVDSIDTGNIIVFNGPTYDNNALLFKQGQWEVLGPLIQSEKINLLDSRHLRYWTSFEAMFEMSHILHSETQKIDGIICGNDNIAAGVIDALELANREVDMPISGQDGVELGLQHIADRKQGFTILKPVDVMASQAAEIAVALAKNEPCPYDTKPFKSGTHELKYIELHGIGITKSNVSKFINQQKKDKE